MLEQVGTNIINMIRSAHILILCGLYIIWGVIALVKLMDDMDKAAKIGRWVKRNQARQTAYNIFKINLVLIMITVCICIYIRQGR